jgi:hypothetical protein
MKPMVLYRIHKSHPMNLNQNSPVHDLRSCNFKIQFNVIFPIHAYVFQTVFFVQVFATLYTVLFSPQSVITSPAIPLSSFHHQNNIQSAAKITKIMEFSPTLFYSLLHTRILSPTSSESICIDIDTSVVFAPRDSHFLETELRTSSGNTSTLRYKFCWHPF